MEFPSPRTASCSLPTLNKHLLCNSGLSHPGEANRVHGAQSECGTGGLGHATDPDLFPAFLADPFCKVSALRVAMGEATALNTLLSFLMSHQIPGPNQKGK